MHPHPRVVVSSAHPERSAGSLITTAACTLWGSDWQGSSVVLHCDNMGSVAVVNSGYSKVPQIMHLLRCLFFIRAHFSLSVRVVHVPGVENGWGDAISHNLLSGLFAQAPGGHQQVPTHSTQVAGPTRGTTAELDLYSLDTAVQTLFSTGLAASTQLVYCTGSRPTLQFCVTYQIAQTFPIAEGVLSGIVTHLHGAGLTPGRVKGYQAAMHHSQIGVGDPYRGHIPQLQFIVKGLKWINQATTPGQDYPLPQ